jgi:hypothetical protein
MFECVTGWRRLRGRRPHSPPPTCKPLRHYEVGLHMYICIYCIYIYMCVYMRVCMYIYKNTSKNAYMCTCIFMCIYMHMSTDQHASDWGTARYVYLICVFVYMYVYMYIYMYIYIYVCMYIYMCVWVCIHIYPEWPIGQRALGGVWGCTIPHWLKDRQTFRSSDHHWANRTPDSRFESDDPMTNLFLTHDHTTSPPNTDVLVAHDPMTHDPTGPGAQRHLDMYACVYKNTFKNAHMCTCICMYMYMHMSTDQHARHRGTARYVYFICTYI